jgi:hypothetical protein
MADPYLIVTLGRIPGTLYEPIGLTLDPARIRFASIDEQERGDDELDVE